MSAASSDEQTLWLELLRRPEDMAPRLALAKLWGGDRGDFIRAQIDHSDDMRAGRRDWEACQRFMRQLLLLQGNEKRWAGAIAERVHEARFLRGFVEWIVVDAAVFVRDWRELFALAPIRHLCVAHAANVAEELFDCPGLERIVALSVNRAGTPLYQPLGDAGARALAASRRLVNLRYLNVGHSGLSEAALAEIASSPNLAGLEMGDFYGNAIPDLSEESSQDYDGSMLSFFPGPGLVYFESRYGRRDWLHAYERKNRQVFREEF